MYQNHDSRMSRREFLRRTTALITAPTILPGSVLGLNGAVAPSNAQPRVYHDVIVQISDDEDFIADVKTIFNNDHDNSAGMGIGNDRAYFETYEGKLIDARGVKGRFVRVFTNGSTTDELNRFTEIEIWGQ